MATAPSALTDRVAGPLLLLSCLLLGGASAAAPVPNAVLQIMSIGLVCMHLLQRTPYLIGLAAWPLWTLAIAAGMVGMQLVPLPPAIWSRLPNAEPILAGFRLAALTPGWSPLSWAPDDTVAALLALLPPTAVFVCVARSTSRVRGSAILLLVLVAIGMTLLGVAQRIGGADSGLYPYLVTNPGQPVGLFANRNHLATLLLCALPFVAVMARKGNSTGSWHWASLAGTAVILCGGVLLVRSDAGLLMLPAVLGGCGVILLKGHRLSVSWRSRVAVGAFVIVVVAVGVILLQPSPGRSMASDQRRGTIIPNTMRAAMDNLPFGTGGGSFRTVYPAYGDPAAASLEYVNHAHSDYAELLLEYGVGGAVITIMAFGLVIRLAVSVWRRPGIAGDRARAGVLALFVIVVHSAVDYPLRTAALAAVAGLATALAAVPDPTEPKSKRERRVGPTTDRAIGAILIEDL